MPEPHPTPEPDPAPEPPPEPAPTATSSPPRISVFVITRDAARHLDDVLASAAGADEILVVDSGSTDATLEIAERHGARIIRREWPGYWQQKAFAVEACAHEWIVNLDADEVLPPGGFDRIRERISRGDVNGLWIAHDDVFFGHSLRGARHHRYRRIYRKDRVRWDPSVHVHEHVEVEGPLDTLPIAVVHHGYDSAHGTMEKVNRYSLLKAIQREEQGRGLSHLRLLFIFPLMFVKFYVFRRMFLSGWRGYVKAMIDASQYFLTEAKLYERAYRRARGDDPEKARG